MIDTADTYQHDHYVAKTTYFDLYNTITPVSNNYCFLNWMIIISYYNASFVSTWKCAFE